MKTSDTIFSTINTRVGFKNLKILEIGCNNGKKTVEMLHFKPKEIVAIDNDKKAISEAKKTNFHKDIKYLVASAEKLPFSENEFDQVIFSLSLHHANNMKKALSEACRVLNQNGFLVIVEPGKRGTGSDYPKRFGGLEENEEYLKKKARDAISALKGMNRKRPSLAKAYWHFDSADEFSKTLHLTKSLEKLEKYMKKHNFKFWGERRIDIFQKF